MTRYVCIHGHFYQPPRENPWLERVEMEEGASPYHDWNHRITAECYAPNAASRIVDSDNMIVAIVNNYSQISFNFGPTLLSWMERESPEVYRSILEADRESQSIFSGFGSALAQPYNHMIMPLANRRDKRSQILWGMEDFTSRFKRKPQGMWLPETAVDTETLEAMAGEGIEFTLLSPHQASSMRYKEDNGWTDVREGNIDARVPYLCRLPSGRSIIIFFYNRQISSGVAFSNLLKNGHELANTMMGAFSEDASTNQLVHFATDGETYGHHHKFGEMALSYCLNSIRESGKARITNYAEYLARNPPSHEVRIFENTSWSCTHGIERWRDDCGCTSSSWTSHAWKKPLRGAMDWLRDSLSQIYEGEAIKYLRDPWSARDEYIVVVLDHTRTNAESFLKKHSRRGLSPEEETHALKLLELQRNAMLMYTSCGWYFDDMSGIEALQVLKYAARAIQLAKDVSGIDLEDGYLERLRLAAGNKGGALNGAELFRQHIKPKVADLIKVGVHYAISSVFNSHPSASSKVYSYSVKDEVFSIKKAGQSTLLIGRSRITSDVTLETQIASYAVLWLGGNAIYGGARPNMSPEAFDSARHCLQGDLGEGEMHRVMASITSLFRSEGCAPCTVKDLFKDKQVEIINRTLQAPVKKAIEAYAQILDDSRASMDALEALGVAPPLELEAAAEVTLTKEATELLRSDSIDIDRLETIAKDVHGLRMAQGKEMVALEAQKRVESEIDALMENPTNTEVCRNLERLLSALMHMDLPLNLWRAQNKWYALTHGLKASPHGMNGTAQNAPWAESLIKISQLLGVRL